MLFAPHGFCKTIVGSVFLIMGLIRNNVDNNISANIDGIKEKIILVLILMLCYSRTITKKEKWVAMKARLSGKELQVRQEIFTVCDALFAQGFTEARDYSLARVRDARIEKFGTGGHFNSVARYKNEWLELKGLVVAEKESRPTLSATSQEPVVQSAFDAFLEEQTQKVRLKLEAEFEEKIACLEQARDEALNRADELTRQQLTLKTLLDRKQSEIAGFNVSAKAQTEKSEALYQENARLSLELAALNKKLESFEQVSKKKWADEQAILYAQLNSAQEKSTLMEESFAKEQQAHAATRDKFITLNEKQRLDAMGERVNLEDKLSKQQARFSASQARLKDEITSLLSKLKGVEAHCEYLTGLVTKTQEKAVAERQALFELQQSTDEKRQKSLVKTLNQHQKVLKDNQYDNFEHINNKNRDVSIAVKSLKREVSDKMSVLQQTLFSHTQESELTKKQLGELFLLLRKRFSEEG